MKYSIGQFVEYDAESWCQESRWNYYQPILRCGKITGIANYTKNNVPVYIIDTNIYLPETEIKRIL